MIEFNLEAIDASSLTPKQRQVAAELKRGKSPKQIAKKLGITPAGVYGHIRGIKQKEEAGTPTEGAEVHGANENGNALKALPDGGYEQAVVAIDDSLHQETSQLKEAEVRMEELQREMEEVSGVRDLRRSRVNALMAAQKSLEAEAAIAA